MEKIIKYAWIILIATGCLGILVNMPYETWKKAYLDEVHYLQLAPLRRIDATNRYIEAIESGQEDISKGISPTPPAKYYRPIQYQKVRRVGRLYIYDGGDEHDNTYNSNTANEPPQKTFDKPLYKRDPNNPNILHKVH